MTKTKEKATVINEKGPESFHIVRKGEKLSAIATSYGMSVRKLMHLNELTSFNVKVGDKLKFDE